MIPFNDLTKYAGRIKEPYLKKVGEIIDNGGPFILGEEVGKFEEVWAKKCKSKYCVAVSSGADAIYLSLLSYGIGHRDTVVTQGNAYNATVTSILRTGADVEFVDINEDMTIDTTYLPISKVVVSVNLYGKMNKHIPGAIEDCAHSHGFSGVGAYSFYPTKVLGSMGDAGAVVTNDENVYRDVRARRDLGRVNGKFVKHGHNMRMDPFQAVALNLQLEYLDEDIEERDRLASRYDEALGIEHDSDRGYYVYVMQSDDRDELVDKLLSEDIQTAIHYDPPVYKQSWWTWDEPSLPVTEYISKRILSLPLFIGMTEEQQDKVISCLKS